MLLILFGGIAGALVGSFVATLCLRWPKGEQVATGRSRCDGCEILLGPRDLVPMLSAALAGGKCRACAVPIEPLHNRVELAAALAGAAALALSPDLQGWVLALLLWLLLPLAVLDARHLWLPDRLTAVLGIAGLAIGGLLLHATLFDRVIGGLAGFGSLALLALGYRKWRGIDGLGGGDPKLLGAIGLWIGWQGLAPVLLLASLGGLGAALAGRKGRLEMMPFGTLLCLAAAVWATIAVAGVSGMRWS